MENSNPQRQKTDGWLPGMAFGMKSGWEPAKVIFWGDANVLKLDCDDGLTIPYIN